MDDGVRERISAASYSEGEVIRGRSLPSMVRLFRCEVCGGEREVSEYEGVPFDDPLCGRTTTDMNRFADGGWVRTEVHESHGVMELLDARPWAEVDPFADVKESNRVAIEAARADEEE